MEPIVGNRCIFSLLICSTSLILLGGIADASTAFYVFFDSNEFNWLNGGFIIIGIYLDFVAFSSFYTQNSIQKITWLLFLLISALLLQTIITVSAYMSSDYDEKLDGNKGNATKYVYISVCCVIFLSIIATWLYRRSLQYEELIRDFTEISRSIHSVRRQRDSKEMIENDDYNLL